MDVAGKPGKTVDMCVEIGLKLKELVVPRPIIISYDVKFLKDQMNTRELKQYLKPH